MFYRMAQSAKRIAFSGLTVYAMRYAIPANGRILNFYHDSVWLFDELFDAYQKGHCLSSIYDTVVVSQSQIHHWPHDYLAVQNHGSILDFVHAQYAALGNI
jgi:hypothetical protein